MLLEAMEIESKLAHRFSVSAYVHLMPEPNGHLKHIGGYDFAAETSMSFGDGDPTDQFQGSASVYRVPRCGSYRHQKSWQAFGSGLCKEPRYRITGPNKTQSAAGCVRFCEIVEELTA